MMSRQVVSQFELRASKFRIDGLQSSSKVLLQQLEEKTRVLGVVSHDIRQPLSNIMVSSEMMLSDTDVQLPPKYTSMVKNNLDSAKFMNRLVSKFSIN
jgi:K+-sensing histidine kinase KdpD